MKQRRRGPAVKPVHRGNTVTHQDAQLEQSARSMVVPATQRALPAPAHGVPAELEPLTREPGISVQVVRALADFVERSGVPRGQFLLAARLEPEYLEDVEVRVPRAEIARICEVALDLTRDPALGLHWGHANNTNAFAPTSLLVAQCATLREALEAVARFELLLSHEPSHVLMEYGDEVTLSARPWIRQLSNAKRFSVEMLVSGFYQLVLCFHARAQPRVSFEHAAPAYRAEYTRLFGGTVSFEQPFSGLVFERHWLDAASAQGDAEVCAALRAVAEQRVLRMTQRDLYAPRVRELLVQHGRPHRVAMKAVARSLGLSVRSLQRRLASEECSYGAVQNEAVAIVAKRLLRDRQLSIKQAAYELGFSSTSPFHRAFRRWTGTTPGAYRDGAD